MKSDKNLLINEFCRMFDLYRVGKLPVSQTIKANGQECEKIAQRLDLLEVKQLEATFRIEHLSRAEGYNVDGELRATVSQNCIITSDVINQELMIPMQLNFRAGLTEEQLTDLDLSSERDIFGFEEPTIDLGEVAVQYLSLNIDPYPRKIIEEDVIKLF